MRSCKNDNVFAAARSTDPILVIEDDRGIRTMLVALLAHEGLACAAVETGPAASLWLHAQRPIMVILDLGMPEVPGEGVLQELLTLYGSTIPVITMTTADSGAHARHKRGTWTHLHMPFMVDDMLSAVYSNL